MGIDTISSEEQVETIETSEQLVATPGKGIVFVSPHKELVLVLEPRRPIRGPDGAQVDVTPGLRVQFRDGHLRLDGEKDAEVIERLGKHRLLGNTFEGFWRAVESAPEATPAEMQVLVDAAIALDVETLERFIGQEEGGFARDDVLETARGALARVLEVKAAQETPPAA